MAKRSINELFERLNSYERARVRRAEDREIDQAVRDRRWAHLDKRAAEAEQAAKEQAERDERAAEAARVNELRAARAERVKQARAAASRHNDARGCIAAVHAAAVR